MPTDTTAPVAADLNQPTAPPPAEFEPAPEPGVAAMLREFEDTHLGADAPRIDGKVERGHGSPFSMLSPEDKAEYTKIEKLVETEAKVAQAREALQAAEVAHDEALAALNGEPDAAEPA